MYAEVKILKTKLRFIKRIFCILSAQILRILCVMKVKFQKKYALRKSTLE